MFNVEPEANGSYSVEAGDTLALESVTTAGGVEYAANEATVIFFKDDTAALTDGTVVPAGETLANRAGTMPKASAAAGHYYFAVVFQGDVLKDGSLYTPADGDTFTTVNGCNNVNKAFSLSVLKKTASIEGAKAFEYDENANDKGVSDEQFAYTGSDIQVAFKLGDKMLTDADYDVAWIGLPDGAGTPSGSGGVYTVTEAGTYTARLTGKANAAATVDYSGTFDVAFTVDQLDLAADSIYVQPATSLEFGEDGSPDSPNLSGILVNDQIKLGDVALAEDAGLTATLVAYDDKPVTLADYSGTYSAKKGKFTFHVTANDGQDNVVGSTYIDAYIVDYAVQYNYNGVAIADELAKGFDATKGTTFVPGAVTAVYNTDQDATFDMKVTNEAGEEPQSYTEPGTYSVVIDTPVTEAADGKTYAGHYEGDFEVTAGEKDYTGSVIYVSANGKNVADGGELSYTGSEYVLNVVVRDAKNNVLAEGEDYTWKLLDAEGNEAEAVLSVGDYKVDVEFNGTEPADTDLDFSVEKAKIESAKAAADFFATDGETAAVPSFVGYTEAGQKGQRFELSADEISVAYYAGEYDEATKAWEPTTVRVNADELTEERHYYAQINILSNAENVQNGTATLSNIEFVVTKTAAFNDVAADAWYADAIYKAAENQYMNGVAEGIFAPEQAMTRAEFARVVANMAGVQPNTDVEYPTRFTDVPANAWFAQAVEWASRYGIVTGTSATTFDPYGTITREQIATMLYRYAGNGAQADLSVLDQFEDADQVSAYAEKAMAWAVENGYVNGVSDTTVAPSETATRAQIAAIAVRVQPERL